MLWTLNILLCVIAPILFKSVHGTGTTSEPQKYALHIIDLNAEHRQLAPISGYVQFGGNLVGDTNNGEFGESVAIDRTGTTIVVREQGTGTIHVYENAANGWTQKGQDLTSFPIFFYLTSGRSVAISRDGSIVAVSSPNNEVVVVFEYDTSTEMWLQRGSTIQGVQLDGSPIDLFGVDIALTADGNKIAVGAWAYSTPTADEIGFATTYFWNGIDWVREDYRGDDFSILSGLYGETTFARVGWSVTLSGDGEWFAVGMPGSGPSDSDSTRFGECRVYHYDGFIQQSNVNGGAMFGSTINDLFVDSVALNYNGSIVAVGSPGFDVDGSRRVGRVQVFRRTDQLWIQLGSDIIGDEQDDYFGTSIDLSEDGKTLVAGSVHFFSDTNPARGYARIYKFDGTDWVIQEISRAQGFDIDGIGEFDNLGYSVAVSGDGTKVLVGAPRYDDIPSGGLEGNGLVQMWGQTEFPTFSPILNPLPQVGNLGTGGSPAQTSLVNRAFTWWQGAVAYLEGFLFD
ncbi:expressed unknown protein [Seminavis robusta]|uniref:Uncharacterized protein n=1 Tax=Seminavis robusta TaxID=568900 RepID=A0A9N8EU66_9STRA|nr:expressed unknown protein [Seminavis robusta]|eukprot:Sro1584_g284021.1  (512) ;mRNA; f:10974-12666